MDYTTWVTGKGIAVRPEVSNFRMDIANCPIIGFPRRISGKKGQQNRERGKGLRMSEDWREGGG